MRQYRVRIARAYLVTEETVVDVKAKSNAEACNKALKIVSDESLEWKEVNSECTEEPRVTETYEVKGQK